MNDDELRASLARRASAPLGADDRNDILRAARTEALKPAQRGRPNLFPRVAGYLVGAVAVIVLVLIALRILLSPPTVAGPSPNPSDFGQPTRRVVQVPPSPGEESPTPTASSGPHVYSEQELADLIGDPNWDGKTVLADLPNGAIGHDPCGSPLGTPVISCNLGSLNVLGPHSTVVVGLRDATAGDGRQDDQGNGYTWVKQLEWPIEAGTYALQVNSSDLDYLGPAHLVSDGTPTSVMDAAKAASQVSDDVYVVNGWLGHTLLAPCAFPQQGLESPMPDISSYYCGGSWLVDQQWDPPTSGLSIDGGMHVQNDAYDTYAPNPDQGSGGGASRFGTYLVRNAGCPEVVTGDCPVWRMVGRLDDGSQNPVQSAAPSPSSTTEPPTPTALQTAPSEQIPIRVAEVTQDPNSCSDSYTDGTLIWSSWQGHSTNLMIAPVGTGDLTDVTWPFGYSAIGAGPTGTQLLDPTGAVVANTGDNMRVRGTTSSDGSVSTIAACGDVAPLGPDGNPIPNPVPPGFFDYITLNQASAIASHAFNGVRMTLKSYAAGDAQIVPQVLFGASFKNAPTPPDTDPGALVWGFVFQDPTLGMETDYIDLFTGRILDIDGGNYGSHLQNHQSDIQFVPPSVTINNGTSLDVYVYVNDALVTTVAAGANTTVDPTSWGPAPWTIRTATSSGRQLTTGVLDPKKVWAATGDYPLESQSFGERIDLSCGRLDVWAGGMASGPAPFGSYPPGDCAP